MFSYENCAVLLLLVGMGCRMNQVGAPRRFGVSCRSLGAARLPTARPISLTHRRGAELTFGVRCRRGGAAAG